MSSRHPLLGQLVRCTMLPYCCTFCGVVRAVKLQGRGRKRRVVALRVQRPVREGASPRVSCRGGELVEVPLERVDGRLNRRRSWPNQVEAIQP